MVKVVKMVDSTIEKVIVKTILRVIDVTVGKDS